MQDVYEEYRKALNLPEFDELDNVFEISNITSPGFPLRDIRRHIVEKLRNNTEILEDIIHPNSTVSAYHEIKFFSDEEKKDIYDLYGRLMSLIRTSNILDIKLQDELDANFIKNVHSSWPELSKSLKKIFKKLESSWSEEEISDKSLSSYFG